MAYPDGKSHRSSRIVANRLRLVFKSGQIRRYTHVTKFGVNGEIKTDDFTVHGETDGNGGMREVVEHRFDLRQIQLLDVELRSEP